MRNITTRNTVMRKSKYISVFDFALPLSVVKEKYTVKLIIEKRIKNDGNDRLNFFDKIILSIIVIATGTLLTSGFLFLFYIIKSLLGFDFFDSHVL
ncbi:MAG: hypothetical protein GY760_26125 [Deltaproteobacteria bacterium]|nr:hypothetical protein [Deltaproteobacteria bacterium]